MGFRIDFGRVFPGVILLIIALLTLFALVLVTAVSFLFSFIADANTTLHTALELMAVPGGLAVAGIVVILTGVSWKGKGDWGWISGIAKARAKEDRLRLPARTGEVIGVVFSLIIFLFLYENQLRGVAFFAPSFGGLEQFFFYGPIFVGIALSLTRVVYGRKNGVRPFDALDALFLTVAAFWLLSTFPFDFTHLGDLFPASIQFMFAWLTNGIGRALFVLAGIASMINFVYTTLLYSSVRSQLHR